MQVRLGGEGGGPNPVEVRCKGQRTELTGKGAQLLPRPLTVHPQKRRVHALLPTQSVLPPALLTPSLAGLP